MANRLGVNKQDLYGLAEFLVRQNIPSLSPEVNGLLINLSIRLGEIRMCDIPKEIENELFAYVKAVDTVAKTNTSHQMVIIKRLGEAINEDKED